MGFLGAYQWIPETILIGTGFTIPVILYALAINGPNSELPSQLLFYGVPSLILVGIVWLFRKTLNASAWKTQTQ